MLKLKKLQIHGFKSFCDRTELQFPGMGVVGIVGPNGCGKSNLADAISWVLGEQSAKSLRGGRMEDVIFAGTRDRPATGLAEVTLTLIDPQEYDPNAEPAEPPADTAAASGAESETDTGWGDENGADAAGAAEGDAAPEGEAAAAGAGGEHGHAVVLTIRKRRKFHAHNRRGEIVVTRRLYRNGESEYLMNGRPCRLRDIQDLFLGTGLGPESYAIIEQGRIGQILSTKPYDRRAIIEEAAGISKYKARRRLAEARLEASRLNLSRINDIFEEVTRQVASLKRQASKAERYRVLKADFDRQQRNLLRVRAEALALAQQQLHGQMAEAETALRASRERIAAQEAGRAEALAQTTRMEEQLRQLTAESGRLQREADHARQQISFQRQQAGELEQRRGALAQEKTRLQEQIAGLDREREQAEETQAAAGELAARARAAYAEREAAHRAAAARLGEIEQGLESTRRQTLELMARTARLGNQIAQGETVLAGLARQIERLEKDEAAARAELAAGGERQGQLRLAFQDQESEAKAAAERAAELERAAAQLQIQEGEARKAVESARTRLAGAAARRRSIEEIVAQHGYSSDAVQRLFAEKRQPGEFQPLGVLGEFLEVDAPYDQVLEQFLHDELNYIVVKDWDQAGAGVGLLRTQEQGRATFLVHAGAAAPETEQPTVAAEDGLVPLLGEVKALNGFRQSLGQILPRLRDAYLAAGTQQAQRLAAAHPRAYFLTASGECFHNFTVTGGAGANRGPLSLKRELRELARRQSETEAELSRCEQNLELLIRQRAATAHELDEVRNRRHELEKRLLTSRQAVNQVEIELQRAQRNLQQAQVEGERLHAERRQAEERLQAARDEHTSVAAEAEALRQRESGAQEEAAQARLQRESARQAMSEAQTEAVRVEERATAARAACERLARQRQEGANRTEAAARELDRLEVRQRELAASSARLDEDVVRLDAGYAAAVTAQTGQDAALADAREHARAAEAALEASRAAIEEERQKYQQLEVARARIEADQEHLRQTCRDDLGVELESLLEGGERDEGPGSEGQEGEGQGNEGLGSDPAALETSVRELRQKIDNLGPVNMMALEEFEEARERHTFMESQRQDLLDSIADTQKAIQEMDTISRQKFQEAFERINANFQETFRILFGGGQGFLRLSEIEGASEAGVDIVAQPPGKKLQNALLLSGGEKAMTAMALLMAVFRYQPSPFCLLDEVDAPMDEANVVRLSDMVRQMSGETQFILITHNKRSMEAARTLYGVTMTQPGVSRLVSVEMGDEPQAASA